MDVTGRLVEFVTRDGRRVALNPELIASVGQPDTEREFFNARFDSEEIRAEVIRRERDENTVIRVGSGDRCDWYVIHLPVQVVLARLRSEP